MRKRVILHLWLLTILGKHKQKSDVIKKAKVFKEYGGVLASMLASNQP